MGADMVPAQSGSVDGQDIFVTPALNPIKAWPCRESGRRNMAHMKEVKTRTATRNPHAPGPTGQASHEATHIIHTPAAMFRGWTVMQLKRPEMAQAWERDSSRN